MTDTATAPPDLSTLGPVGFLGAGRMGAGMWHCLHAAGLTASVFDLHVPATRSAGRRGGDRRRRHRCAPRDL